MPPRLPTSAVEAEYSAIGARQLIGADSTGDSGFRAVPGLLWLEAEQGKGAHDDRPQRCCLTVIGHIDALAGAGILLRAALEGKALDMDEHARNLQAMAAAGMDADPTILVLATHSRGAVGRNLALVLETRAYRGDGFFD